MTVTHPTYPTSQDPTAVATYGAVDTEVATLVTNTTKPAADATATVVMADVIGDKADTALASPLTAAVTATASLVRYLKTLMARTIAPSAADNTTAAASASEYETIGRKDDTATETVGTTTTLTRYIKGLLGLTARPSGADNTVAAATASLYETIGRKDDAATMTVGTTTPITRYTKGLVDVGEKVALKSAAVMVDNDVLFTVAGGPIKVLGLWSECVTANDATASTLVYKATPTTGAEQTLSAASASLANATAGASVSLIGTALTTAALYNANGPTLGMTAPMIVPAGTIGIDIAVGSTTGTWRHYLRYEPLASGVTVS